MFQKMLTNKIMTNKHSKDIFDNFFFTETIIYNHRNF